MLRMRTLMAFAACYTRCSAFMTANKGVIPRAGTALRLSKPTCTPQGKAGVRRGLAVRGGGGSLDAVAQTTDATGEATETVEASPVVPALISWMEAEGVDAFIIPSDDPHLSEYSAECFNRRAFVTGFTGSAGTAVVLKDESFLWTDGRYHLQAEQQLGEGWTLMKAGKPSVPTINSFLAERLPKESRVGIDPFVHSVAFVNGLKKELSAAGIAVAPIDHAGDANPVDAIWGGSRPEPPQEPVRVHPAQFAGETVQAKLEKVRENMAKEGADVFVSCMLDEVAYLLNIRGNDVAHCPVAMAYALVTPEGASLFIDRGKLSPNVEEEIKASLRQNVHSYEEALGVVRALAEQGKRVWIDPDRVTYAFANVVPEDSLVSKPSPISLAKGVKNQAELEGMRAAHVRDGVAMVLALSRLERDVAAGQTISEVDVDLRTTASRAQQDKFVDLSFPTIAGEGTNGAIIHYGAEAGSCRIVGKSSILLLDSGAQYEDGTTDVTRTMHFGEPTAEQKEAYTRVLQGHIGLATATFPDGTPGFMIDSFARRHLWDAGLDYQHGTGHGVGAALNVHEGPHSISSRTANPTPLEPGMIVSNEPGYYKGGEGGFGIRIENLLEIVDSGISNEALGRRFYRFEPLTLIPMQKKLLDQSLLSPKELDWLDDYHHRVSAVPVPQVPSP
ncbi:unnamed protein product, partial [Laminaria digitata]